MWWKQRGNAMKKVIDAKSHGLHSFAEGKLVVGETEDGLLELIRSVCGIGHVSTEREHPNDRGRG